MVWIEQTPLIAQAGASELNTAAALANFPALKERLVSVDRMSDTQEADFLRRPRQSEASSRALGGHH